MELKFVIPNMEKTFGNLEFTGEDKVIQRRINGQLTVLSRSYNLYSDVQRADDIIVILPAEAGEKNFAFEAFGHVDDDHEAMRFVCSWATKPEAVDALIESL